MRATTPGWVTSIHALGDDCTDDERMLLAELAAVLNDWPVRNPVVHRALQAASLQLLAMARQTGDGRRP